MLETRHNAWRDFTNVTTLCRRAGCSKEELPLTAVKEIIDNALDVSPAGLAEAVIDGNRVIVHDRGPGMSEAKIVELFNVAREAVSTKRWRQAKRGALGNGLRVVMGVVHATGSVLTVESRGLLLLLDVGPDGSAMVMHRGQSWVMEGTRITLEFGVDIVATEFEKYIVRASAGAGVAFGGTKAVPQWFDTNAVYELMRDVDPDTSVLVFAQQFDIEAKELAAIKRLYARKTIRDLLFDDESRGLFVTGIVDGGKEPPRELKRMGRNALDGFYAFGDYTMELGDARLPVIIEAWTRGNSVLDRHERGHVELEMIYANRTPALQSKSFGNVWPGSTGVFFALLIGNSQLHITDVLKGPCNFTINVAITCPELPIISEGKAVDFTPFTKAICDVIADTLKRAYLKPLYTLAETKEAPEPKPQKPPTPIKEKKVVVPHDKGVLGTVLDDLARTSGRKRDDLIVMSKDKDPFSIGDSRRNHKMGAWLAAVLADPAFDDRRHARGIHYKLARSGTAARHDGKPYVNTDENWRYMLEAVNAARWLGYIPFDRIRDQRNAPPVIRQASDNLFAVRPGIFASTPSIDMPSFECEISLDLIEEEFPHYRQPYHIVLFGEKSSLEPVLGALAERFNASLYLPTGEISTDFIHTMARNGAADGRRMIVLCFSDFDPTGQGMPVNIARKLQALKALTFPALEFEVHAACLTAEQAIAYDLPSSPLKPGNRSEVWKKRYGREQTELDALESDQLREIALAAIGPFFDRTLDQRRQEAQKAWTEAAEQKLEEAVDPAVFDPISAEIGALSEAVQDGIDRLNAKCVEYREAAAESIEIEFEDFDPPKPIVSDATPPPLVSTDMEAVEFIDVLKARRVVSEKSNTRPKRRASKDREWQSDMWDDAINDDEDNE